MHETERKREREKERKRKRKRNRKRKKRQNERTKGGKKDTANEERRTRLPHSRLSKKQLHPHGETDGVFAVRLDAVANKS